MTAEGVQSFIETAWDGFDPCKDMHLFFLGDRLIAYERTKRETWADGTRVYHVLPFVHPEQHNRRILGEILGHVTRYQSAAVAHDRSDVVPFLSVIPDPEDGEMIGALRATGYVPCHRFLWMHRRLEGSVAQSTLPEGVKLRPLRPAHHRTVYRFDRRIMHGHWGVEAPTETHFQWWSEEAFLCPELWRVAWHGDKIVGTSAGILGGTRNPSLGGQRGEIRFVRVDPGWRRRGVASALIISCLSALHERGIREVVLGVDGANEKRAAALYRSLGFEVSSCRTAYCLDLPVADASRA